MKYVTIVLICLLIAIGYMAIDNAIVPKHIGVKDGQFANMPRKNNAVSSQTNREEKYVEPLPVIENIENSKLLLVDIIKSYESVEIITETDTYIHAVFTTLKMKFNDDVELYFDDENQLIHYRSESRVGQSDLGLNRLRYEDIKRQYLQQK